MRLKTTIKLFFQNLGLVWKLAVYKLITYSLTTLLVWLSAMPIVNKLTQEGFFAAVKNVFTIDENILTNLGGKVAQLLNMFLEIISNNWSTLSFSIIMLIAVVTLFSYFINALADIPTCEVLYGSMSCNAKFSFVSLYIKNFSKSLVYSCVKMFSAFIADAVIFSTLLALINLCTLSKVLYWLAPCLAVCAFILLFSFRLVLFSCFAPSIVLNGYNAFKSLAKGVKLGFKHFIDNYATASIVVMLVLSINVFFALFTFGSSLFITLPASLILITVFDMVVFYSSSGMYYYVGENNIQDETKGVKRLEQQDTVKDLKNII